MPRPSLLRAWVTARLPVLAVCAVLARGWVQDGAVAALTHYPSSHSMVKGVLLTWQTGMLRGPSLLYAAPIGIALCLGLSVSRGWAARLGLGALALALILAGSHSVGGWVIGALALALEGLPSGRGRAWRWVAAIPGSEIVAFRPVFTAVFATGPGGAGATDPGGAALRGFPALFVGAVGGALAVGLWFFADIVADMGQATEEVARWPDSRVDKRASVLDRVAPPGVFDFQDIDRVGDHLVVVGENPPRLMAYPLDGGPSATFPLRPFWANETGMAVDSVSDVATGRTWFLAGPATLGEARYSNGAWTSGGESHPVSKLLLHGAMQWFPETQTVAMVTLNVTETRDAPRLVTLHAGGDEPLGALGIRVLRTSDGQPLPVVRDAVWVPPIRRFVLAPDFGGSLYLMDPETGLGTPWLPMSTLNGRLVWDPTLGRLFVARPERSEIAIVDPVAGRVERTLHTEAGVRALAVDAGRGLVLTASVVTGAVDVYRLADGERVDRYTGFMPMVRNLQLIPERGLAVLSTWAVLYEFPYGTPAGAP